MSITATSKPITRLPFTNPTDFEKRPVAFLSLSYGPDRNLIIVLGMVFVLSIVQWLLRSRNLIDWDAVNYALGLQQYDVIHDQPHMPGYYLYILIGRFFLGIFGEANAALVALSYIVGSLCTVLFYLLGRDLFGRRAGLLAALLSVTSPMFWFQSSVASSRIMEGFFALLIAYLCTRIRWWKNENAMWLLALAIACAGGIRQQIVPFIFPLCIWATWRIPLWKRLAAIGLLAVTSLGWFLPMLHSVGGLAEYQARSKSQWEVFVVAGTGVFYAKNLGNALWRLFYNTALLGVFITTVMPLSLALIPVGISQFIARYKTLWKDERLHFLLLATVPAILFLTVFHIQQIGHVMTVAPFYVFAIVAAWDRLSDRWRMPIAIALAVSNLAFIFFSPVRMAGNWFTTPSLATMRYNDDYLQSTPKAIRRTLTPENSVVLALDGVARPFEYYLPEYTTYGITVDVQTPDSQIAVQSKKGILIRHVAKTQSICQIALAISF